MAQRDLSSFFSGVAPAPPKPSPKTKAKKEPEEDQFKVTVTKKQPSSTASPASTSKSTTKPTDGTTSKHFPSSTTKTNMKTIVISSDEEGPAPGPSKPKTSSTNAAPKRPTKVIDSDSDEDMQVDEKPKLKSKPSIKRKAPAVESTDESSEEDTKKAVKKKVPVAKPGTKSPAVVKKKSVKTEAETDTSDEDVKGKGKGKAKATTTTSKAPPAKKAKKEEGDGDGDAKRKWQFKPKTGPVNPGSKDIPNGADNCLAGLTFVFTGELESLSREEGQELAKRYGGRVTSAPSSKTSYVVLGSEAGPKKLEMIKKHNIKTLNEDQFLELIGKRPAGAADPAFLEKQAKEQEKIKAEAKKMVLKKDAPEHKTQLWTTKYAPSKLTEICGNKTSVEKLSKWLESWPKSLASDFKKPGPDGLNSFRCVLISGPPGIGKTTAAHLVAKAHGYDILELNASDVRSKKLLETAFKSKITDTTLSGFFKKPGDEEGSGIGVNRKSIIIMDEVDGMSAGDRGGVGALNVLIRKTKVPIIAICNDKTTPKMKPLTSTCFQMIFKRPIANEIRARMMSIAFKEGMKLQGNVMDQLVAGSQSDLRQILNMLSTWKLGAGTMDFDEGKKLARMNEKNTIQTPWTLYSKLTAPQAFSSVSGMTLGDKIELYFQDHSIMPLFVQDNYLKHKFSRAAGLGGPELKLKNLEIMSAAADAISDGDLVDRMIHGNDQQWSLMPLHGVFSCVRPAYHVYGPFSGGGGGGGYGPSFPAWFGKNSTQTKLQRLLGEIQINMRLKTSGDRKEIRQSYIPTLFAKIVQPLLDRGSDAIEEVIELMDEYYLTKENWDALVELGVGPDYAEEKTLKAIPSQTKSAFTRTYNKGEHPVPFHKPSVGSGGKVSKKLAAGPTPDNEEAFIDEDAADDDEDENVDSDDSGIGKDKLIKQKTIKGKGKSTTAAKPRAKAAPKTKK